MSENFLSKKPPRHILVLLLISTIAAITQGWSLLNSFKQTSQGIVFFQFHDTLWHLSLINELTKNFPPSHPGISGLALKNYHYLSDTFFAFIAKLTPISPAQVYLRLGPILGSFTFTFSTYLVSKQLIKSYFLRLASTLLVLFGSNLAWIIPLFGLSTVWYSNSFMLDQPFDLLTNVHTYFGFSAFLFGLYLLIKANESSKPAKNILILSGVVIGLTFSIKAYAGLIGLFGLATVSFHQLTFKKEARFLLYNFMPALLVFFLLFLSNSTNSQAGLIYTPGWLLDKMVEDSSRLEFLSDLALKKQHYQATNNTLRLSILFIQRLIYYLVGNLGVRLIGTLGLVLSLTKIKSLSSTKVFFLSTTLASLSIPILFNQGKSAYNIVQFGQYALILSSIYSIVFVEKLFKNQRLRNTAIILIISLSLPTTIKSFSQNFQPQLQPALVSWNELEALTFLNQQTDPESVILTHPDSRHQHLMIVPGLAGRKTYFSGDTFSVLTGADAEFRVNEQRKFFHPLSSLESRQKFLSDAKINYIYLDKPHPELLPQVQQLLSLEPIFNNSSVTIYQVE